MDYCAYEQRVVPVAEGAARRGVRKLRERVDENLFPSGSIRTAFLLLRPHTNVSDRCAVATQSDRTVPTAQVQQHVDQDGADLVHSADQTPSGVRRTGICDRAQVQVSLQKLPLRSRTG